MTHTEEQQGTSPTETIMEVLRDLGRATINRMEKRVGASRRVIRRVLCHMTETDAVHAVREGSRTLYFLKSRPLSDCSCDRECISQIHLLMDEPCRQLLRFIAQEEPRTHHILRIAQDELGLSERSTFRHLRRLQEVGLVRRARPEVGDRRGTVYRSLSPHPTTLAHLEEMKLLDETWQASTKTQVGQGIDLPQDAIERPPQN